MVGAWILTIPGAAVIGAAAWEGASAFSDGNVGIVVVAVLAAALAAVLWVLANRTPVHARDLDRTTVPVHA
jgi:PiT family inorganic phosphate transporter